MIPYSCFDYALSAFLDRADVRQCQQAFKYQQLVMALNVVNQRDQALD